MPNNKSDYHIYPHSDPGITTMGSFVGGSILSIGSGLDIVALLNYEDENGRKNLDNLIDPTLYTQEELTRFKPLIDQIRNSSTKEQTNKTTFVTSNSQSNANQISVTSSDNVIDPNKLIVVNNNSTRNAQLKQLIKELELAPYKGLKLTANQSYYLSKLANKDAKDLFKRFIFQVSLETDYDIFITSSFRLVSPGVTVDQILASKGAGDTNRHSAGLALDVNLIQKKTGKIFTSAGLGLPGFNPIKPKDPKNIQIINSLANWKSTKVLEIAQKIGLVWGGSDFTEQYDPVHFDARNYFDIKPGYYKALVGSGKQVISTTEEVNPELNTEQETVSQNSIYADLPLHLGTILNLPLAKLDREILSTEGNQVVNMTDFNCFLSSSLLRLLKDKSYERTYPEDKGKSSLNNVKEIYPHISVWVWSRASSSDISGSFNHTIYNITPYISALNTAVGSNGGSFSIDIASIEAEVISNSWTLTKGTQKASVSNDGDYVNNSFLHYEEDGELKRNRFFFEKAFQQNDIVFIRFEKLKLEEKRSNLDALETISINDIPGNVFDMIGLIDSPSLSTQPSSANVTLNLSGRDLVKLLIEDGIYFYPADFISGGIFANETGASNQRLNRFNGEILTRFQTSNKTIDRSMKFIINNLSSIDICPTSLFDGYSAVPDFIDPNLIIDERSKSYQLTNVEKQQNQDQQKLIDDKKRNIIDNIDRLRKSFGVIEGTPTLTYNIIESFLSSGIQNGTILEDEINFNGSIKSWSETIGNLVFENQQPSNLGDKLFIRDRSWVYENNFSKIKEIDRGVISSIEDLFRSTDKKVLEQRSSLIFNQLFRVDSDIFPPLDTRTTYDLSNIIKELKDILSESVATDGIIVGSDLSTSLLKTKTLNGVFFGSELNSLERQYDLVKEQGRKIKLLVIEKKLPEFTNEMMSIFNDIYKNIKDENNLKKKQQTVQSLLPVNGIWQIIKLIIDPSVKERLIADATIGNEMGSLINGIRKICQEPFVEFFTDTYFDQFYFIVRKPPFDSKSIQSFLLDTSSTEEIIDGKLLSAVQVRPEPIVINIEELDVINDSLTYSTEAYSWYRLQLKNQASGSDSDMAFAYLKAVYFNEYADIFGSKPLDVTSNYVPLSSITDKNTQTLISPVIKQGINDLKYLIESHAYLPFTRKGTIVINGDRRIKRGTFIRYKSTNEIYYVDSVSNSFSINSENIDRTTTLTVSRGMVEDYIEGVTFNVKGETKLISYFNICDLPTDALNDSTTSSSDITRLTIAKWKVIPEVFNFFVQKLQFAKNSREISPPYMR